MPERRSAAMILWARFAASPEWFLGRQPCRPLENPWKSNKNNKQHDKRKHLPETFELFRPEIWHGPHGSRLNQKIGWAGEAPVKCQSTSEPEFLSWGACQHVPSNGSVPKDPTKCDWRCLSHVRWVVSFSEGHMSEGYDLVELLGFEFSVWFYLTVKRSGILRVSRSARPSHVPRCQAVGCLPCCRVVLCPSEDRAAVMAVMAVMVPFWCWQSCRVMSGTV